jgi:hypothetical protein
MNWTPVIVVDLSCRHSSLSLLLLLPLGWLGIKYAELEFVVGLFLAFRDCIHRFRSRSFRSIP